MRTISLLKRLWADRGGAVGIIGALSVTGVLGMGAFAVDINQGYHERMRNQRIADMAALAAAVAYQSSSNAAILVPTAQDVALANGLTGATVTATVVADTPAPGQSSVRVTVSTMVPFALGQALGFSGSYEVGSVALANLPSPTPTPACFIGLSTGTAISTSGGATINTPNCGVAGVGSVNNGGTGITASAIVSGSGAVINNYGTLSANQITYATSFTNPAWNTNVPTADKRFQRATTVSDPLANDTNLAAARTLIGTYDAPPALANPSTSAAADWTFNYSPAANVAPYRVGTSAVYRVPAGTYSIGRMTVNGGITVIFEGSSTINIHNGVSNGGSALTFPSGTVRINGGFNSGSSGVTFGDANVHIGSGTVSFAGTSRFGNGSVIINAPLTLSGGTSVTMGNGYHAFSALTIGGGSWMRLGDGNVDVIAGVNVDGGGSTFAAGNGNYRIGPNGSGNAIVLAGSSWFISGDGEFSTNGNIDTQGGSRIIFGVTTNHLINGNMIIRGGVLFGAGRYTVDGNIQNGTGGATWPAANPNWGTTYGSSLAGQSTTGFDQVGVNVTFVNSGTLNLAGGAQTKLIASTTTTGGAFADILFSSLTSSATTWGAGSGNVFVGTFHLPNSAVTMSGGNTTLSAGQCFMLIANSIAASGGAQTGSACGSIPSAIQGGATQIGLVR